MEALMDPTVDRDSEQEARDWTTATSSSRLMAVPTVQPQTMDYEEGGEHIPSVCRAYTPQGADPRTLAGSSRPVSVWGGAGVVTTGDVHVSEGTSRDVRLNGKDPSYARLYLLAERR